MTSDFEVVLESTTSAQEPGRGSALHEHASQVIAQRLRSTVDALGWLAPSAHQALEVLEQSPDRAALLSDPALRYTLAAMRRCASTDPQFVRELLAHALASFAWPRALVAGSGSTWFCRLDGEGGLRAGGTGIYLEFGERYAGEELTIAIDGDRAIATFPCDGLTVEILAADLLPDAEELPVLEIHGFSVNRSSCTRDATPVTARDPFLRPHISGTNQRTDGIRFVGDTWEHYRHEPHLAAIESGLDVIRDHWPAAAEEIALFVRAIVPLTADRQTYRAFTVLSRQGAVFLGDAPPLPMAEMLLHETAHVKLRQLQLLDGLLVDPLDETQKVKVPWRPDPRPLPGVLEGLFVFSHVAELQLRRLRATGADDLVPALPDRLAHLRRARAVLEQRASLTSCGRQFIGLLEAWIERLSDEAGSLLRLSV